jgi:hypothetical protein
MAVRIAITLEGVEEAQTGFNNLAKSATDAGNTINQVGQKLSLPPVKIDFGSTTREVDNLTSSTIRLGDGLRILRPVLQEIGVHMTNMREFSALAAEGTTALGVAIAAAATVALVKFNDGLQQTQAILGDFLGSQARGAAAFTAISTQVAQVGSSATDALPGIESLIKALQETGAVGGGISDVQIQKITNAFSGLFTALRAGHASITEANTAWVAFTSALETQGKLTDTVALTLAKFPGALDLLKKAFNQGAVSNAAFIESLKQNPQTIQATISAMQRLSVLVPESFDPKAPQSLADSFTLLWEAVKQGAGAVDASNLRALETSVANATPAVKALATELAGLGSQAVQQAAGFLQDVEKGLVDSQRQIANTAALWTQLKVVLTTPVDTEGTTAPIVDQFSKLIQMLSDIKRTGFALPELDPQAKADIENATKDVQAAKTAFDDFSRTQFGKGQFVTIGVDLNTKPAQDTLTKFVKTPLGKGEFITIDAKIDFPEGVPLPKPKPDDLTQMQADFKQAFQQLFDAVQLDASAEGDKLSEALGKPVDFTAVKGNFEEVMNSLVQFAQDTWQRMSDALSKPIQAPPIIGGGLAGGGLVGGGLAGGGLIRGPGTSTSDSILSWLSNFEYVMRAAAVQFYGVDFMHALNAMRLPKDLFKGFSLGGLVIPRFPAPGFAQGGLAVAGSGGSRVFEFTVDGPSKVRIRASSGVVDELERAADLHNIARIGRAPGWVGR